MTFHSFRICIDFRSICFGFFFRLFSGLLFFIRTCRIFEVRTRLFLNPLLLLKITPKHNQLPRKTTVACCRRASTTAQHNAISHAQSSEARTCRSERDNASKQTELARAAMPSSIYLPLAVFSIEICPAKKNNHTHKQLFFIFVIIILFLIFPISISYDAMLFFLFRT